MYHQQRLSGASLTTQRHTPDNLGGANFGGTIREERPLSLSEIVSHTQAMWKLQTDDNYNATLREDFFFEQVSILKAKSNFTAYIYKKKLLAIFLLKSWEFL